MTLPLENTMELRGRYLLVRGRDNVLRVRFRRGSSTVRPASVTVTVRDAVGETLVDAEAATISDTDEVSYTVLAAVLPEALPLQQGWVVVWDVTFGTDAPEEHIAEAALVRNRIAPPASVSDLTARIVRLSPGHRSPLLADLDVQTKLDEAWLDIEDRLYLQGVRAELVMSPSRFREPHKLLALALIFEDLQTSNYEAYTEMADRFRSQFLARWRALKFTYDGDEDGQPDGGGRPQRPGTSTTMWTNGRGRDWYPYRGGDEWP